MYAACTDIFNHDPSYPQVSYQLGATISMLDFAQILCQGHYESQDPASEYNVNLRTLNTMLENKTASNTQTPFLFLYKLLHTTAEFSCKETTDRVFALLGMVNSFSDRSKVPRLPFRPDYQASSTVTAVFTAVTKEILEQFQDVIILTLMNHSSDDQNNDLPSWVPDFGHVRCNPIAVRVNVTKANNPPAEATGNQCQTKPGIRAEGQRLYLKAFQVDIATQKTSSWSNMFQRTHCEDLSKMILSFSATYRPTGQNRTEALWRTIIHDTAKQHPAEAALKASFHCWLAQRILEGVSFTTGDWSERLEIVKNLSSLRELAKSDSSHTIPTIELLEASIREASQIAPGRRDFRDDNTLRLEKLLMQGMASYEQYANMSIAGRLVFVTEKAFLGSGPEWMKIGDSLWIVPGSSPILVLREHPNESTCYQLVGEAYLHGLNPGEVVSEENQWKEICLL